MTPEQERQLRGQRIREIREKAGLTMAQLGDILKVSAQAVNQWEQGDTSPTQQRLKLIAIKLGADFMWLRHGISSKEYLQMEDALDNPFYGRRVPLISTNLIEIDKTKRSLHTYFGCDRGSFAWEIKDQRNAPLYKGEDVVIIDRAVPRRPGDMVLAHGDNSFVLGMYTLTGQPPKVELKFLNKYWGTYLITDPEKQIIGVVVEHTRRVSGWFESSSE
jgi:transcriptional regulator with XRE-family HTH domain